MPAKSKAQFRLMKAAEHNPKIAKKVGIKPSVAAEFTQSNVDKKAYSKLPEAKETGMKTKKMADGGGLAYTGGTPRFNEVTGTYRGMPTVPGATGLSRAALMSGRTMPTTGIANRQIAQPVSMPPVSIPPIAGFNPMAGDNLDYASTPMKKGGKAKNPKTTKMVSAQKGSKKNF